MDLASIIGVVLSVLAICGGHVLEGGHLMSIVQPTAALIVVGGTVGAVLLQYPAPVLKRALTDLKLVFKAQHHDTNQVVESIVSLATKARREGLVAIEQDVDDLPDAFMRRGFQLAVDGTEAKSLRAALEMELTHVEEGGEGPAKVWESAGGYSPTIGILGAVLGLIHVMENLSDPAKLGSGIAVAFVATVYGVGAANLVFLPIAGKLKQRHREEIIVKELMLEGVCAVAEGENPRLIARKLEIFLHERKDGASAQEASASARAV